MASAAGVAKRAFTDRLYVTVLVAIALGAVVGLAFPGVGVSLQPLGDTFIAMIRMLIGPVVFCTIVTGIASAGHLTSVGRIGIKALVYFEVVTTLALIIGLVAMDLVGPGRGIHAHPSDLHLTGSAKDYVSAASHQHWYDFLVNIVPKTVVSAFVEGNVLQVLFVAILFAVAVKLLGERGEPVIAAVERLGEIFFGVVKMVMYFSPIGAFGAMAFAVGKFGGRTLSSLGAFIGLFWAVGILFGLIVFGAVARLCGLRILKLYRYFKDELLITLGTANYEAVMPRLIEKLERLGCPKRIVSLVVPSGYAFNGDGVCLYLGFASLFIAQAFGVEMSLWQQIGLLAVFLITSKGSAGVAGSGFIILAATLSTTGSVPVVGIMLILGIDRLLSTMRGLVSLGGQILGSLVVSRWERVLDVAHARAVLNGEVPAEAPHAENATVGAAV
ncbi:cation:dicarboxylate symporter family transporter [Planosporangium sp. 12N6]|uniref:cation:dicarboxylate symporter family transporter n=1 Tax=Planosporangium spinosum TaxID=3402278 RepID=UPI003CF5FB97